jgi:hypothetical protein
LSWALAWASATAAGATATILQTHTIQPPPIAEVDFPHDPRLGSVDQGTYLLLALTVAGITFHERFRFDRDFDAATTDPGGGER